MSCCTRDNNRKGWCKSQLHNDLKTKPKGSRHTCASLAALFVRNTKSLSMIEYKKSAYPVSLRTTSFVFTNFSYVHHSYLVCDIIGTAREDCSRKNHRRNLALNSPRKFHWLKSKISFFFLGFSRACHDRKFVLDDGFITLERLRTLDSESRLSEHSKGLV